MRIHDIVVTEASVAYKGQGFQIIKNPSAVQINNMLNAAKHGEGLRGIIGGGHLYAWDGYFLNHDEAAGILGLDDDITSTPHIHLFMDHLELDIASLDLHDWNDEDNENYAKIIVEDLATTIRNNRSVVRFYGNSARIKVDDGQRDEWLEDYLEKIKTRD